MLASQIQGFVFCFFFFFTPVSLTLKTVLVSKKALYSIYWITQCLFKRYVDLIMHSCLAVVVLGWRSMIFKNTVLFFFFYFLNLIWASLLAQLVKNLPAMQETWIRSLGWEDPLEKEMATHSSILAWKISWREEPGELQSMGS